MPDESRSAATGDEQRRRVYAAEDTVAAHIGPALRTWRSVEAFLGSVVTSDEFNEWFPEAPCGIGLHRRSRSATASAALLDRSEIWLRDGSWNATTVLHELAHLLCDPTAGHGPRFVATELILVRRWCGFDAYGQLRHAMDAERAAIDEAFLHALPPAR